MNATYQLNIAPASDELTALVDKYYSNHGTYHEGDSGLDVFCIRGDVTVPAGAKGFAIGLGVRGQMIATIEHHHGAIKRFETARKSYYMLPRSSISGTPLRLANSIGLIDSGYTGELIAKVDNVGATDYTVAAGTRLFQIALPTLEPFTFQIVSKLDETARGSGGFGSTERFGTTPTTPQTSNVAYTPMFGVCQ